MNVRATTRTWSLAEDGHIGFSLSIGIGGTPSMYPAQPDCQKIGDDYLNGVSPTAEASGLPHDNVGVFCNPALLDPLRRWFQVSLTFPVT